MWLTEISQPLHKTLVFTEKKILQQSDLSFFLYTVNNKMLNFLLLIIATNFWFSYAIK